LIMDQVAITGNTLFSLCTKNRLPKLKFDLEE